MRTLASSACGAAIVAVLVSLTACQSDAPSAPVAKAISATTAKVRSASDSVVAFAPMHSSLVAGGDPVVVAAGNIACGSTSSSTFPCQQAATAALIGPLGATAVLALGNNQYERGTLSDYNAYYARSWGAYKSITYPVAGAQDYRTTGASGYFDYFNGTGVQTGRAGDRSRGYYSFNVGTWHVLALNSDCAEIGGCGAGSPQEQWLRADLAANGAGACTLAFWNEPLFSSGPRPKTGGTRALWQALQDNNADVVLSAYDDDYERFAPQTAAGVADATHGLRAFVVGTGGKQTNALGTPVANSAFRSASSLGVLKLVLHSSSYDWQFVPVSGPAIDAGTAACNQAAGASPPPASPPPVTNQPPVTTITSPTNASSYTQGTSVTLTGTATDPQSGTLSGSALVWTSSINGALGTGVSLTTAALTAGVHTITLTASDPQGLKTTATRTIIITAAAVTNKPPVAQFVMACNLLTCTIDASGSTDDVGVVKYTWNWGDGRTQVTTTPTVTTLWAVAGLFNISLTVADAAGLTNTISKAATLTAPAVPVAPTSAEPAGMTLIEDRAFNCLKPMPCETNWAFSEGYPGATAIVQDATAPKSAPNVLQQNFTSALTGGSSPAVAEYGFSPANRKTTIYVSMWLKFSSNFVGHPTATNKITHFFVNGTNHAFLQARGVGNGTLTPALGLQGIAAPYFDGVSQTATGVNLLPNVATAQITRGQWQHYELVLTSNTAGVANGSAQLWLDGVKVLNYTGIMFVGSGASNTWETIQWSPTWGGLGGSITSPFYMQMDDMYISAK